MANFYDGIKDLMSGLINRRSASNRSQVDHLKLSDEDMRAMFKSGLMSRAYRLKIGYAFNDTLSFDTKEDGETFNKKLLTHCKKAAKFMLGFGRGVIVVFNDGDDLSKPLKNPNLSNIKIKVFSGDVAKGQNPDIDLRNDRYMMPKHYIVRGHNIHYTRVVDFNYFMPTELELPSYSYGGISESELVYPQFINDEVVQRAVGIIVDKASTFVYSIDGYKQMLADKKHGSLVDYINASENTRSLAGALLTDAKDGVTVVNQSIADLDKVDQITLRRIAMVLGLGMTDLIGEQPGGLNSSGSDERENTRDTIKSLQSEYLLAPINQLAKIFGLGEVCFKDEQMQSPTKKAEYENKVASTAKILWEIGEDASAYLESKSIQEVDEFKRFWSAKAVESDAFEGVTSDPIGEGQAVEGDLVDDKTVAELSMNGAQVTALKEMVMDVTNGTLQKETAIKMMLMAFPIDRASAQGLLSDVVVKPTKEVGEEGFSNG